MNTCSVTATADQGARQTIRRIARDNPSARIVVTGCYATRAPATRRSARRRPGGARTRDKDRSSTICCDDVSAMTTAERFGGGDGPCGRRSRRASPAGRRSRCGCRPGARSVRLLHHPDDARPGPEHANRGGGRRGRARCGVGVQGDRAHGRAPRIVRTRSRRRARRCSSCCARSHACRADVVFRVSSLEPMDCTPEIVALDCRERRPIRAALPPAAAARERSHARAMRRPYTLDFYRRLVDGIVARLPHAVDRLRHDCRISGRDRRRLRRERPLSAFVAAVAPARVPILRPSWHGGVAHGRRGCRPR